MMKDAFPEVKKNPRVILQEYLEHHLPDVMDVRYVMNLHRNDTEGPGVYPAPLRSIIALRESVAEIVGDAEAAAEEGCEAELASKNRDVRRLRAMLTDALDFLEVCIDPNSEDCQKEAEFIKETRQELRGFEEDYDA